MSHLHRWSTIKRWQLGPRYFIIQRCRRCDEWIRRELTLNDERMDMSVKRFDVQGWKEAQEQMESQSVATPGTLGTNEINVEPANPQPENKKKVDERSIEADNQGQAEQ